MAVNTEELHAILTHIREHPETWHQPAWGVRRDCGTVYCLAGHAIVRAGLEFEWVNDAAMYVAPHSDFIFETAQELLGLTDEQAERLFAADNSLDDLERLVREFTE